MIETWQESSALAQSALEDTDYYMSVQEKHMASMQGKLNSLRASMEGVWNSLLDTGTLNTGIDLLNLLAQAVQGVVDVFASLGNITGTGALPSALGLGELGIFGTALFGNIKEQKELALKQWEEEVAQAVQSGLSSDEIAEKYKRPSGFFKSGFKETIDDMKRLGLKQMQDNGAAGFTSYWQAFKAGAVDANGAITNLGAGIKNVWENMTSLSKAVVGFSAAAAVIGTVISLFNHFTDTAKEAREAVENANTTYQKQISEQQSNRSYLDSISAEWQQLSKGVDLSGNNISLTNDEFERYHELCNQIAGIIPNVVSGYDSQNNAILSLNGSISELNAEYEKLIQNQAQSRFDENYDTYMKNFKNETGKMNGFDRFATSFGGSYSDIYGSESIVNILKKAQGNNGYEELKKVLNVKGFGFSDNVKLRDELRDNLGISDFITEDEYKELLGSGKIRQTIDKYQANIDKAMGYVKQSMKDYITTLTTGDGQFADMDENIISYATQALMNSSEDQIKKFSDKEGELENTIYNWFYKLQGDSAARNALSELMKINADTSIEDLKSYMQSDLDILSDALGIDDDGIKELKIQLKLEGKDELIKSYDEIVDTAAIKLQEEGKKQLDSISKTYKNNLTDIDLYNRPVVSSYEMNKHGWKTDDGTYSTYFSDIKNELDENGNIEKSIVFTPIYKDEKGNEKVLTPDEFEKETERILAGGEDTKGLKIAEFDSKDYKDSAKAAGKFAERLHKASDYYDLLEEDAGRVKDFIEDNNINTKEQIDLLNSLMDKYGNWSDVMANWGTEAFDLEVNADSLDALESNLDIVKEKIGEIQDAYKESITSSGMTKETIETIVSAFSDLDGYNYDKLFESTASGVHMNAQELAKMNAQYEKHEKAKYEDKLKEEIKSYEDICQAIEEANTLSEKQALIRKRDGLAEQIQRTNELISRYEGLTNAVTKYQQALEMGEEGDIYDSIVSGYENAKTLWEKGLVGTNEFKAFTQMFSNEDLTGKGVEAYVNAWQAAQGKMTRWLSEGGEGVENFLYDIRALNSEWAKLDANGNWNLDGLPDMKTLAKNLGISESLIDQMMRKLHDYGFEIDFSEAKDNLRYMLQDAKEINKQFGQFSQFGLNDDDLKKVTSDAEQLQKMKEFKFNLEVSDPKALDEQISIAGKLRTALVDAFGNGSEEVEKFDKQLDYLKAKRGELTDVSSLVKEGYSLGLDFTNDKEALDEIIEKLMTIKGFNHMGLNLEMNTIDDVNDNLDILTGKINNLAKDGNGKVDLSAEGAAEALEVYSALLNKKKEFEMGSNNVYTVDPTKLKTGAQQNAIEYLQAFQNASIDLQNAYDINNLFGAGTIDVKPLEKNMLNTLGKIKNSGEDIQAVFRNLNLDLSDLTKISPSDYTSMMNYVNSRIKEISLPELSGIGGDLTNTIGKQIDNLDKLKNKAMDFDVSKVGEGFQSLNLELKSSEGLAKEIKRGEELIKIYDADSEAAKALQAQLDYLNAKKEQVDSSVKDYLNLDLNYSYGKDRIDQIVESLHSIDKYKHLKIDFKVKDPDDIDGQITNISKELEKLKDPETGKIDFSQEGAAELMDTMIALYNQKQLLTNEHRAYMNVDTSGVTGAQKSAIANVQQLQNSMDQLNKIEFMKKFVPDIDTSLAEKAVADAWKEIQNGTEEEKRIYANLGIEPDKIKVDSDEINDETQKAIQDELDPIDCEVLVNAGYDVNDITILNEAIDRLKDKNVKIDIDWENKDPEYWSDKLDEFYDEIYDNNGELKIDSSEVKDASMILKNLNQQVWDTNKNNNISLRVDIDELEQDKQQSVQCLIDMQSEAQKLSNIKIDPTIDVETFNSEAKNFKAKIQELAENNTTITKYFEANGIDIVNDEADDLMTKILDLNAQDVLIDIGVGEDLIKDYQLPSDKRLTVDAELTEESKEKINSWKPNDRSQDVVAAVTTDSKWNVNNWTPKTIYQNVVAKKIDGGVHKLNGTAHLNGTAYANGTTGNWGAKKTETALVGEVAPELRVNSKTGRWELLGEHGAEFAKINKGDVIFNHKILWSYTAMCMYKFI